MKVIIDSLEFTYESLSGLENKKDSSDIVIPSIVSEESDEDESCEEVDDKKENEKIRLFRYNPSMLQEPLEDLGIMFKGFGYKYSTVVLIDSQNPKIF